MPLLTIREIERCKILNTILNIFRKNQPQEIETRESKRSNRPVEERVHLISDLFRNLAFKLLTEPRANTDSVGIRDLISEFANRTIIDMGNPDWQGWYSTDHEGYYYNRIIMLKSEWERQTKVLVARYGTSRYPINSLMIKSEIELLLAHMNDLYCTYFHNMDDWQRELWEEWQYQAHRHFNNRDIVDPWTEDRTRLVINIADLFNPNLED